MRHMILTNDGIPFRPAKGRSRPTINLVVQLANCPVSDACMKTEEIPDDWVVQVRGDGQRPCVGRETGYWMWSRAGFAANKDRIKAACDVAGFTAVVWTEALGEVERLFQSSHSAGMKHESELMAKVSESSVARRLL